MSVTSLRIAVTGSAAIEVRSTSNNCCRIQSSPPSSSPSTTEMAMTTSVRFVVVSRSGQVTFFNLGDRCRDHLLSSIASSSLTRLRRMRSARRLGLAASRCSIAGFGGPRSPRPTAAVARRVRWFGDRRRR